jgi:hypothetical protein
MIVENANIIKATRTSEVSPSIDPLTTQATLGTVAQNVTQGELSPAARKGYITKESTEGVNTYIGQYAMTPKQLEKAGIIKPGSSGLVQSLMSAGVDINKAMPPAIFTGKSGAKDYNSFVTNIPAQSNAMVKNLQVAQTSLQNAGLITGGEAPSEINGVVLSAATNGVDNVLGVINSNKNADGTIFQRQPLGQLSSTQKDIEAGNYAGKLAESGLGTLSGVESALQGLAKTPGTSDYVSTGRGLAADAYETIKNSIGTLKPNTSNDLTTLQIDKALQVSQSSINASANELAQQAQGRLNATTQQNIQNNFNSVGQRLLNLANVPSNGSTSLNSDIATPFGDAQLPSLLENPFTNTNLQDLATSTASGALASTAAGIAAGLNNLPGSLGSITSITDFSKGNGPLIPGTADMQAQLKNLSTDAINNIQTKGLDLLGNLNSPNINGLVDMVSKKLPAGAAALLQNAAGSIAAAGLGLKSPSAGINTVPDRQTIASELKNAMNDPSIPEPNYIGVSEAAKSKVEQTTEERKEFITKQKDLKDKYNKVNKEFMTAYTTYAVAENNLPQGSSILSGLKAKYEAKIAERAAIKKQLDNLYTEFPEFGIRNTA